MENKEKIMSYNDDKGMTYIKNRLKKYDILMSTYIAPKLPWYKKLFIGIDFAYCVLVYGAGINDYFQYNFYKRRAKDRKTFIVGRKWLKIIRTCNGEIENEKFDNKGLFNEIFKDFIKREWLDLENCTFEEFAEFVEKHKKVIYKRKVGSGGQGTEAIDFSDKNIKSEYDKYTKTKAILEELIEQSDELGKFNPESVNSLRVVTIVHDDEVKVMNGLLRMGNGLGKTDNFHTFGLAALVDVESGIVITQGVDKNNDHYIIHPRTNEQIIGYKIASWDKIVEKVKEAALVVPEVRYVGWDVALLKNGDVCFIEGNCAADPDASQITDQIGKWKLYKDELDKLTKGNL